MNFSSVCLRPFTTSGEVVGAQIMAYTSNQRVLCSGTEGTVLRHILPIRGLYAQAWLTGGEGSGHLSSEVTSKLPGHSRGLLSVVRMREGNGRFGEGNSG